jgi:hypothetical protein
MRVPHAAQSQPIRRYHAGDRVRFTMVNRIVEGRVVEDRGNIGVGGRQLVRIIAGVGPDEFEIEMPADEIRPA